MLYMLLCSVLEAEFEGLECHLYYNQGEVFREGSFVLRIEEPMEGLRVDYVSDCVMRSMTPRRETH